MEWSTQIKYLNKKESLSLFLMLLKVKKLIKTVFNILITL